MDKNICPRCMAELIEIPLYKCVRCFSVYCKECEDTSEGRFCPQCKMSQRMIISTGKKQA